MTIARGGTEVNTPRNDVRDRRTAQSVSKIGLVPGDFILKIDGTAVNSYKQVAILFEQAEQGSKPEIDLTVWNPATRRTSVLKAILEKN
jgi:hypothetical protein